jgi:glycine cleavage system H protein
MIPTDLKYTESHEWVRLEGNAAVIGITHFAQDQLTDIVFVELPEVGRVIAKGGECAVIESCKIAAEMYAPVSGTITAVNEELSANPAWINQDPYGKGWIAKMELSDPSQTGQLMDAAAYQRFLEQNS